MLSEVVEDDPPPAAEGCRLIDEFALRMRAHFEAEETEYFATLVAACPRFEGRVAELRLEHEQFLERVQRLRAAFELDGIRHDARSKLAVLISDFRRHEGTETILLQEFLVSEHDG
jgi:hypothetical protein